jgi:hypothetical protein
LSPQLVEAILQRQQSVELTATRLTELDLPLDWIEQHRLKPQFRTGMAQAAAHRVRASLQTIGTFRTWDCINAGQRKRAKERRFAA